MKKLIFLSLALSIFPSDKATAASETPARPSVTSKWFIGLDSGCTSGYFNPKRITTAQDGLVEFERAGVGTNYYVYKYNLGATRASWGTPGITALLNLGYDCKLQNSNVVVGFFAGGGISKTSAALPSYGQKESDSYGVFSINAPVDVSTSGRFQAGFRFGSVALGAILPVFTLGWSTFKSKVKIARMSSFYNANNNPVWNNTYASYSVGKWINCLMVGFGLEFNLTPALILGFSSNVHIGGSPKYSFTKSTQFNLANGKVDDNISMKVHAVLVEMLATLKYAFPTCR